MKRILAAILCLCMMLSMTGCAQLTEEDWNQIQSVLAQELKDYIAETGSRYAQQLKSQFREKLDEGARSVQTLLAEKGDGLSTVLEEQPRYGAKGLLSSLLGKREKGSLQAFIAQQYGPDAGWETMDPQTRRACVREYFGDTVYTVSKSELRREVAAFLKAESDASGTPDDYRLDTLAGKRFPGKTSVEVWQVISSEAELLSTTFTPQLCASLAKLSDQYVPSLGILVTTVSFLEDWGEVYSTDPSQMEPEEVLDKLVNLTTSAIDYNDAMMWVYDIPFKMAMTLAKKVIENAQHYELGLSIYDYLGRETIQTIIDTNRWGNLCNATRVQNGEGPTAAETAQVLVELSEASRSNPNISQKLLRQLSEYLQWRIVYDMTTQLEAQGYTVEESVSLLQSVCDRLKGLF